MDQLYDLFEVPPGQPRIWRASVRGLEAAVRKLKEIARQTTHECLAMLIPTRQVVALENITKAAGQPAKPVVFQIAYDEQFLAQRAEVLNRKGYKMISLLGNERARAVLSARQDCDLFIVGKGVPESVRKEMVIWLKREYPKTKILAINPRHSGGLDGADYNVEQNDPETWLPFLAAVTD
jgi:hypothetical protein